MSSATESSNLDIIIYRGWKDHGKHVWSPFVVKLEARLRFAGVKYTTDVSSPKTAPKGKIPYLECWDPLHDPSSRGTTKPRIKLGDSTLIIKTLARWNVVPDINAGLSPAARTQDMALRALLEDKLYFYHTWERWILNYYAMRDHSLWQLPYPVRVVVGIMVHRNIVATLHGQGTGRYTADEIATFRLEIWKGVNDLLVASRAKSSTEDPDKPFWVFGGQGPTEADASLFGFIVSVLLCTASPASQKVVKEFPIIVEYAGRLHDQYFPNYEKWTL
ncbi:uncharacterized protein BCR38DRAFT_495142 [Pseudomassariella vexata]|uniref:Thioredoxin-like fold domain-containing protein n=1 Tax=Pseudomassariella vexata TaxID=1141098 RepID=A0A1Y2DQH3_9PEZI|nr:uncharacterized protein BCR38DRAFT_495142 [Pseudomassariella vexata]ORY61542.1 hypothetical protein BCR38DRAFT_495142 [Pseudomassariella vexata]